MFKKIFTFSFFVFISAIILPIVIYFMTYSTFNFLGDEIRSVAFDSLGDSLLHLRADVESNSINWEGFDIDGKKYMYFGPFPSFLRIIFNHFFRQHYSFWARISCLIAICIILITSFFTFLNLLNKNKNLKSSKYFILLATCLALFLGTPIFYLISCCWIYSESALWGLTWSLVAISTFFLIQEKLSSLGIFILGISTSFCLLSKVTYAFPLYLLCIYCFIKLLVLKKFSLSHFFSFFISLGSGLTFQGWYNFARFKNIFTLYPKDLNYVEVAKEYGFFNVHRIYDLFLQYIAPSTRFISKNFPYFIQKNAIYKNAKYFMDYSEPSIPISLSSSFLILAALFVFFYLIKNYKQKENYNFIIPTIFFVLIQTLIILSFYFSTERYICEIIPLLYVCLLIFLMKVKRKIIIIPYIILCLISIPITGFSTTYNIATHTSDVEREWIFKLRRFFNSEIRHEDKNLNRVYLVNLEMKDLYFSFLKPSVIFDMEHYPHLTNASNPHNAFWLHAETDMSFDVPEGAKYFEGILDYDMEAKFCKSTSVGFQIFNENNKPLSRKYSFGPDKYVDGEKLFYPMDEVPLYILVPIKDAKKINIKILRLDEKIDCDHFTLIDGAFLIEKP